MFLFLFVMSHSGMIPSWKWRSVTGRMVRWRRFPSLSLTLHANVLGLPFSSPPWPLAFSATSEEGSWTVPTLWNATSEFVEQYPQHIHPNGNRHFVSDNGESYNMRREYTSWAMWWLSVCDRMLNLDCFWCASLSQSFTTILRSRIDRFGRVRHIRIGSISLTIKEGFTRRDGVCKILILLICFDHC